VEVKKNKKKVNLASQLSLLGGTRCLKKERLNRGNQKPSSEQRKKPGGGGGVSGVAAGENPGPQRN